jgi:hypothetical protein
VHFATLLCSVARMHLSPTVIKIFISEINKKYFLFPI